MNGKDINVNRDRCRVVLLKVWKWSWGFTFKIFHLSHCVFSNKYISVFQIIILYLLVYEK